MSGQQPDKFFCVLCQDTGRLCYDNKKDLEDHFRDIHFNDSPSEEIFAIDLWVDRHIKYQESLNKVMTQGIKTIPDRNKMVYKGCPMCDAIIELFEIKSDPKSTEKHELLIRDLKEDYSGNNVNHINPHLRYYPFECIICEEEMEKSRKTGETDKEVVKTAVKAMMRRHIIDKHLKGTNLIKDELEKAVENAIKILRVTELEKLVKKQSETPQLKASILKKKRLPPVLAVKGTLRDESFEQSQVHTTSLPTALPRNVPSSPQPDCEIVYVAGQYTLGTSTRMTALNKTIPPITLVRLPHTVPMMTVRNSQLMTTSVKMEPKEEPKQKSDVSMDTTLDYQEVEEIQIDSGDSDSGQDTDVTTSEEEVSDSEMNDMKEKFQIFGCVFCWKRYKTYEKAVEHYLCHIKVFIECSQCDKLFTSIADFRSHNPEHNQKNNLKNVNEFKIARKWTENFLTFVTKEKERFADLTRDRIHLFCPICAFAHSVYDITSKKKLSASETVESHLHSHFNYRPFECMDCSYDDFRTEFFLDETARKHLRDKHNVSNEESLTTSELSAFFEKKNSIAFLDKLIDESIKLTDSYRNYDLMNSEFLSVYLNKQ